MVAVLAATLVVGAAVQGLVGLGVGLVSAPVAMLLEPALMPDLLLWLALIMPVVTLVREHEEIDWGGLRWSLSARVPGTVLGVALVASVSTRVLGIVVGVMVLISVLLTARTVEIPVNRTSLVSAGLVSGVAGTATSIGGPPMALLLQHRPPHQIRSTLAVYFLLGAGFSLVGLGLTGDLGRTAFLLALVLSPCLVVGFVLSRWLHGFLPRHQVRVGVLLVCGASAVVLLVRSLS